jgi:hypothetical protein
MASECHDTPMAGFAAISWQLEATAKLFRDSSTEATPAAHSCELARSMVSHCQAEARRIIWDLRDSDEVTSLLSQALSRTLGENHIKGTSCLDATAYAFPIAPDADYTFGNASRNALHGPAFNYANFSVFKNFPIWERVKVQFRAEAFNVTNHPSAANPGTSNGSSTANPAAYSLGQLSSTSTTPSTSGFGLVTDVQKIPGQLTGSRVVQLSGKVIF